MYDCQTIFRIALPVVFGLAAAAQTAPQRPPIVGVAHISLKTTDLAAAREFYSKYLGFAEPFARGAGAACFKVNDHQYIEVSATLSSPTEDRLSHIAFETANASQLRDYLASRGVAVPGKLQPDAGGNLTLIVKDPDGHDVRFVEYRPGSLESRNFGKALPDTRVSEHMIHVGFTIQDQEAANRFYHDILGFEEFWHGGMTDTRTDWVDMRVPDGSDWLEYMLNQPHPSPRTLGVMNHMALGVPSAAAGYKTVTDRGMKVQEQPKIGRDGKWQLNLYDPTLTRAELMEPKPVEKPCCSPMLDK
jgi:catechol 2,3-dioxygenase-like lactoylglutathione lyase family enzyme